jgi:hypothetical protein
VSRLSIDLTAAEHEHPGPLKRHGLAYVLTDLLTSQLRRVERRLRLGSVVFGISRFLARAGSHPDCRENSLLRVVTLNPTDREKRPVRVEEILIEGVSFNFCGKRLDASGVLEVASQVITVGIRPGDPPYRHRSGGLERKRDQLTVSHSLTERPQLPHAVRASPGGPAWLGLFTNGREASFESTLLRSGIFSQPPPITPVLKAAFLSLAVPTTLYRPHRHAATSIN